MGRWLALTAGLAGLACLWAAAGMAPSAWALAAACVLAPAAGLALAARFGALDAEANWLAQAPLALRLRAKARTAPRGAKDRRPGFVRVRLGQGTDIAHAAIASHLGAAGIGVDLEADTLLAYAADDSPAMAAHLHSLEAAASPNPNATAP